MTRNKSQEAPPSHRHDGTSIVRRLEDLRRKGVLSFPASNAKAEFKSLLKKPGALRRFLDSRD
jgi:hypothetical protein